MQSSSSGKVTYKVGDTVTIRDWRDMEREFGSEEMYGGCLRVPFKFHVSTIKYCGEKAKITQTLQYSSGTDLRYKLKFEKFLESPGNFSKEMFVETYAGPSTDLRDKLMKGEFNETLI